MIEKALAILNLIKASAKTLAIIALIIVAGGIYFNSRADKRKAQADAAAKDKAFAEALAAAGQNAVKGRVVGKIVGSPEMEKRTASLIKAGGRAVALTTENIDIKDESKAIPGSADACPKTWGDQYQRFFLDIPSGLFKRTQLFHLEQKFIRSASGQYSVAETLLREFNPVTKVEIPNTGVKISGTYSMIEEKASGPGRWHLRGVVLLDHRGAPGGGISVNPYSHLTLTLGGLYAPKGKDFRGVLAVGYRPFNWTVGFGPYVGVSSKGGTAFGALAAFEVTR